MLSANEKISMYWDSLEEFQRAHDPVQRHHHLQNTSQIKPGPDGKIPTKFSGNANEEMGRLPEAVRRKRPARENVGVDVCNADGVVSRICADCSTSKTPLWRGGPAGPKSLCNACGIRYRKRRRRGFDFAELENKVWMKEKKSQERVLFLLQRDLEEEEEAAVLLMALSRGLFLLT